jgi:outer membrane lipoprotein-sorting protein
MTDVKGVRPRRANAAGRLLSVALLAAAVAYPALAQDPVPLPNLRPAGGAPPAASAAAAADSLARPVAFTFNPNSPFSKEEQAVLANINAYFNSFRLMEGQFVQFGPNGEQSEGVFYLNRPGKIRFHYSPPVRLDVIADGSTVAVKDGKTNTQDMYPLAKTPLRYLLAGTIDLTSPDLVSAIRQEPDLISVVIVEKGKFVQGKLTLIFDRKTYALRSWIVTDAQGLNTSVDIFNTTTGKPQDQKLFWIQVN